MFVALNEVGWQPSTQAAIEERAGFHDGDARDLLDGRDKDGDGDSEKTFPVLQLIESFFRELSKNGVVQLILRERRISDLASRKKNVFSPTMGPL
jgi:hypothetical protein